MGIFSPQSPKTNTVIVSLLLVLAGFLGASYIPAIAEHKDWLLLGGYILLLLGVYIRGL